MSLGSSVEKSISHLRSSLRWSTGHLFKVGPAHSVPLIFSAQSSQNWLPVSVRTVETPFSALHLNSRISGFADFQQSLEQQCDTQTEGVCGPWSIWFLSNDEERFWLLGGD